MTARKTTAKAKAKATTRAGKPAAKARGKVTTLPTVTPPKAKAPRKSAGTKALEAIREAKAEGATLAARALAVTLALRLSTDDPVAVDPLVRTFVKANAGAVFKAVDSAGEVVKAKAETADRLRKEADDAKVELRTATTGQDERSRDAAVTVYAMLDVHRYFGKARDLCLAYGLSEPTVSKYRLQGKGLYKLGSTAPATAALLGSAAKTQRAALVKAINSGDRDKIRAVLDSNRDTRRAQEARRAEQGTDTESRPVGEQATASAAHLATILTVLNSTRNDPMADTAEITGVEAFRKVVSALLDYAGRHHLPWPELGQRADGPATGRKAARPAGKGDTAKVTPSPADVVAAARKRAAEAQGVSAAS